MTIIEDFEKALESGDRASIEGIAVRLVRSGVDTAKYVLQVVASLRHNLRATRKERDDALDALDCMVRCHCSRPDPEDPDIVTDAFMATHEQALEELRAAGRAELVDEKAHLWRLRSVDR